MIAAPIEMNDAAVKVRVVFSVQETGLETVMEPSFGPVPDDPTVEIVTLQLKSWLFTKSLFKI